jgi:hypothetical protein
MDIFSHMFWGGLAFGWKRRFLYAMTFGVLPDFIPFSPFFFYRLFKGTFVFGRPPLESFPSWVFSLYDITHSLIFAAILYTIIRFLSKDISFSFLAWPLHIVMDIPTHTEAFFPTKFLFPLSTFYINGFDWAHPLFLLTDYLLLFLLFGMFFFFRYKKSKPIKSGS